MSTTGNLARVMLVLGSFIRAFGMAGTSGAGLNPGGFSWARVIAVTAIHTTKRESHRNMVTPRYEIRLCARPQRCTFARDRGSQYYTVRWRSFSLCRSSLWSTNARHENSFESNSLFRGRGPDCYSDFRSGPLRYTYDTMGRPITLTSTDQNPPWVSNVQYGLSGELLTLNNETRK